MGMGRDKDGEEIEGPAEAALGIVAEDGTARSLEWLDKVTENPTAGSTEVWEIYNTTADAHPIHIHETVFEVVDRQALETEGEGEEETLATPLEPTDEPRGPEPWETGFKDTVIAYPKEVTRVRATFGQGGQFTWHCHILEHEDNEMMRPYRIGPEQPGQPAQKPPHGEKTAPAM
jgi:FtsP/CotA-like multicopper oxidase with cupredoxin domain